MSNINMGFLPRQGSAGSAMQARLPVEEVLLAENNHDVPEGQQVGAEWMGGGGGGHHETQLKRQSQNQRGRSALEIEAANGLFSLMENGTFSLDALLTKVPGFTNEAGLAEDDLRHLDTDDTSTISACEHEQPASEAAAKLMADSEVQYPFFL
jgi:hypothetical protein